MTTVLVADDDRIVLDMVTFILDAAGFEVTAYTDPQRALQAALATPPDCAVLDVSMPQMSGLEVCRALRADARTAGTPVILLTARGQWLDVSSGFDAGADDYVVKPFGPQDLLTRVTALLDPADPRAAGPPSRR